MAVIKEVEVAIVCGGKELREYPTPASEALMDPDEAAKPSNDRIVRYIEAIANAKFEIGWKVKLPFSFGTADCVAIDFLLDGKYADGLVLPETAHQGIKDKKGKILFQGPYFQKDGKWCIQALRWGHLPTVEVFCTEEEKKQYAKLGTVEVVVWRQRGATVEGLNGARDIDIGVREPVPEKAVKEAAVDLYTSLDGRQPSEYQESVEVWEGVSIDKEPYAVFIFKYRSKAALQALGIIPRTPEPVALEERDLDSLSLEQLKELAHRNKAALEAQKVKIKTEKAESNLAQLAELKRSRTDEDEDDDDSDVEFLSQQPVKKVCTIGGIIE